MITAKIFFSILGLILFYFVFRLKYNFQIRIIEKVIFLSFFILGFTIVFNPSLLDKAAKILNIDRGRDLLFYLFMIVSSWGLIRSHLRINKQSSIIKKLVSNNALLSIEKK